MYPDVPFVDGTLEQNFILKTKNIMKGGPTCHFGEKVYHTLWDTHKRQVSQ